MGDEIRRLDNQKEVSIEEIKSILIKFISRTEKILRKFKKSRESEKEKIMMEKNLKSKGKKDLKKIQKIKRIGKRKNNDGKELEIKGQKRSEENSKNQENRKKKK